MIPQAIHHDTEQYTNVILPLGEIFAETIHTKLLLTFLHPHNDSKEHFLLFYYSCNEVQ